MGEEVEKQLPLKGVDKGEGKEKVIVKRNRPKERLTVLIVLAVTVFLSFGFWVYAKIQNGSDVNDKVRQEKNEVRENDGGWLAPAEYEF
jgi:hypothetical protein